MKKARMTVQLTGKDSYYSVWFRNDRSCLEATYEEPPSRGSLSKVAGVQTSASIINLTTSGNHLSTVLRRTQFSAGVNDTPSDSEVFPPSITSDVPNHVESNIGVLHTVRRRRRRRNHGGDENRGTGPRVSGSQNKQRSVGTQARAEGAASLSNRFSRRPSIYTHRGRGTHFTDKLGQRRVGPEASPRRTKVEHARDDAGQKKKTGWNMRFAGKRARKLRKRSRTIV